jgi:uncharacterized protein YbaP (TraB family)
MKTIISFIFFYVISVYSYGQTSVWKISNGNNVLYIGGTIHVLRESDYPLPEAFETAFENSTIIVFETPNNESDLLQNAKLQEFMDVVAQIQTIVDKNEDVRILKDRSIKFAEIQTAENDSLFEGVVKRTKRSLTKEEAIIVTEYNNFYSLLEKMKDDEQFQLYMKLSGRMTAIMNEDEGVKNALNALMNPGMKPLSMFLEEATYNALLAKCDEFNYPRDNVIAWNPGVAINGLSYHILGQFANARGVDRYFMDEAVKHGKRTEYFEDNEFQMYLIANKGKEYGDAYYSWAISGFTTLDAIKAQFDRMVDCWRRGVEDKEVAVSDSYIKETFPAVYKAVIAGRNNAWVPVIEKYLETAPIEFVLVGNGHMHGPDGLLTQLERKGYKIEQW